MSYLYPEVDNLQGTAKVGTKHCVPLVQVYAKAPVTNLWKEGEKVLGNKTIKRAPPLPRLLMANTATCRLVIMLPFTSPRTPTAFGSWINGKTTPPNRRCRSVI